MVRVKLRGKGFDGQGSRTNCGLGHGAWWSWFKNKLRFGAIWLDGEKELVDAGAELRGYNPGIVRSGGLVVAHDKFIQHFAAARRGEERAGGGGALAPHVVPPPRPPPPPPPR